LRNNADFDDMFLYAGNSEDDGGLSVFGDGDFNLISGNGGFQFKNGAAGSAVTAQLDASGDLTLSGSNLRLDGGGEFFENFIFLDDTASPTPPGPGLLGTGPYIVGYSGGLSVVAGDSAPDILNLIGGNTIGDGSIQIVGGGGMLLRAGNGNFSFLNGLSTGIAALSAAGDLQLDGDLLLGGTDDQIDIDETSFQDFIIRKDLSNDNGSWFRIFEDANLVEQMRIFSGDAAATWFDGAVIANGFDYAESFKILDPSLGPGDVVSLIVDQPEYIERAGAAYSPHLLGVISEKPGFLTGNSFDAEEAADPEMATLRTQARHEGQLELARQYTNELINKK
jgi:hypothetical protein